MKLTLLTLLTLVAVGFGVAGAISLHAQQAPVMQITEKGGWRCLVSPTGESICEPQLAQPQEKQSIKP